jgi:ribosomal protein S12 methylthiotransferase
MLGLLKSKGFEISDSMDRTDIAVINTCGFIRSAVEEAIDTIFDAIALKKEGRLKALVVAGCVVQRYGYKLRREIPEVDGWLGTGEFHRIAELLENEIPRRPAPFYICRPVHVADHHVPRVQTTPFFSAYLKIAEGCSHRCSFCMIPALRGPFRSQSPESIVLEAEKMVDSGVKEINLIAQDTTMYGTDLKKGIGIEELLERLLGIGGIGWLRLLYCHPRTVSRRLLELMESEEGICPYLDLPFQHVNERVLRAMGRASGRERPLELIGRVRASCRRISLRTTVMVGWPGETEEMFEELCDFVRTARFDHLGAFVFSAEEGTPAARLGPRVDRDVAERRLHRLMALQKDISNERNQGMIGRTLPVLIEGTSPETDLLLTGRTACMAPDVDGQVLINKGEGIAGEIMPVRITEAHAYDLVGEIVE